MELINYSIIIPHYNIPDLLMRCLKSIPVREDVQVIVVDDCSPGADKYLELYPELSRPYLEFYSTPQGGSAGRARNVGLEHAKGKWLVFADADDFFVDDFENILDKYIDEDADIIYFNNKSVLSDDITKPSDRDNYDRIFEKYNETHDESFFRCDYPTPWGKIIKHSLIKRISAKFDETRWGNDYFFSVLTGINACKISIANYPFYIVTSREGSLTHNLCSSHEEWLTRYNVALKVQKLIDSSPYCIDPKPIVLYLFILRKKSKYAFWKTLLTFYKQPTLIMYIIKKLFFKKVSYLKSI